MTAERNPKSRRRRLPEIDALRGIAACGVMLFHYVTVFPKFFPKLAGFSPGVREGFTAGSYGVVLFFVISGFVITLTLDSTRHALDFAVRRFARLYPVYWAAILVTVLFVHMSGETSLAVPLPALLANFTMLHGLLYLPSVDGVYWSLLVELAFYACMLSLWAIGGLRRPERVVLGWLALKLLCWLVPTIPWRLQILFVIEYIPFFLIGILLHRIWTGARTWRLQAPYFAACLAVLLVTQSLKFALLGAFALLVVGAAISGRARFLDRAPLRWLGAISYPLYLVHGSIGFIVMAEAIGRGISSLAAIPIAIAVALLLATALRLLIEQPAERAICAWWRRRDPLPPVPVATGR